MSKSVRNVAPLKKPKDDHYEIIVTAAGIGTRMKSYGSTSLITLANGISIIEHQLNIINKLFVNKTIILVCGFDSEKLIKSTPNNIIKIQNERFEETNVARSISIGLHACLGSKVLLVLGDLVFNEEALRHPFDDISVVLIDKSGYMTEKKDEVGCCIGPGGKVENFMYGLEDLWCQIIYLTGKELEVYKQLVHQKSKECCYGFEILNELIDRGGNLFTYSPKNAKVIDVDTSKDIIKANEIIQK